MKINEQGINQILTEYREAIKKTKHKESTIEEFIESTATTLFDYYTQFPEDTEIQYRIRKRFSRIELYISIPGEKKSVYECGTLSEERETTRRIRSMKLGSSLEMQYLYMRGSNILIFLTPPAKNDSVVLNPMILASLIGLAAGLLCALLPASITNFLVHDLASPVLNVAIKLMSGIMGPIIFFSLVTAISTAGSVGEVNRIGVKLFWRFFFIALSLSCLSMVIAFLLFTFTKGPTDISFSPRIIIDMILSVFPTNLITPFTENNFPQLLVLGIVMGIALLLLNRKDSTLGNMLIDLHAWTNELLRLIMKLSPIIPGLTLFKIFAQKDFSSFIQGWKFIVAAYICMVITLAMKFLKVKVRCKHLKFSSFLRKSLPAVKTAFISGSEIVALKQFNETTDGPLGISKKFSSLWTPLNQAMLAPIGPVYYVLAPFFVAEITGTPVSISFLFILLLLSVQLSMAYPGIVAGNTIIFNALGLSTDYVGIFSAYSVFIKNASAAYGILFRELEITETAYSTENIDIELCNEPMSHS